jgi:hypothetical protein
VSIDRRQIVELVDLAAALRAPGALEELAHADEPLVVTRLDNHAGLDDAAMVRLIDDLGAVRAITVAILDEPIGLRLEHLAAAFDIVLAEPDLGSLVAVPSTDHAAAIAAIAASAGTNPQAAVALAQLLRIGAWQDVAAGLAAESFVYSTLQSGSEFAAWLAGRGPATLPPDPEAPVLVSRQDGHVTITFNRPHRANAVTAAVRDALVEALTLADTDPTIEAVSLRGAGASFSSGGDLAEFGSLPDPATAHVIRTTRSPAWWVHRVGARTRAHLHGAAIGAGIELAAFAGTVLAAPDTRIRLPEVAMGLVPGAGGTVSLTRRIGRPRTCFLALTGRELDAAEALAWGVVDRLD